MRVVAFRAQLVPCLCVSLGFPCLVLGGGVLGLPVALELKERVAVLHEHRPVVAREALS